MPEPYVGEIRMVGFSFAPAGWMTCEGQTLPISENEVLFQLIGTTYGGDGESTFQLPNLASRVPIHMGTAPNGTTYQLAEQAGTESETLTTQQIPSHTHPWLGSTADAGSKEPIGGVPAVAQGDLYTTSFTAMPMFAQAVTPMGGSQPHENCQPFLVINFVISLFGRFPSQT
jgi:microcystin-dependent protein